jgi:hypothetical protein
MGLDYPWQSLMAKLLLNKCGNFALIFKRIIARLGIKL